MDPSTFVAYSMDSSTLFCLHYGSNTLTLFTAFIHVYMTIYWRVVDFGRYMWLYEWGYAIFIFLSSFMTYHGFVARVTLIVSHVDEDMHTYPEHLSSPQVLRGVRVARSLVFCVMFFWIVVCPFSFGHGVVCPSIYGFWLLRWYLQPFLHEQNDRYFQCTCDKFDNTFKTKYSNTHQSNQ